MKTIFYLFVGCFMILGCKQSEAAADNYAVAACEVASVDSAAAAVVLESPSEKSMSLPYKKIETKIIKNANLRFETSDLEATYNLIQTAVKSQQAIVQNDEEGKNYESLYRNMTVRIPSKNFDVFIKEISKGVEYFERKEISSQDVTEEYIDIDARLKAKKVLEIRYLELLKKANKVSEMLEIETQLSAIREEIEAKEGQLRYMQSRVSMSTIHIEFYKSVASSGGARVSFFGKIWNAICTGFNSISIFFIELLENWPIVLFLIAAFYFIRKKWKNRKAK